MNENTIKKLRRRRQSIYNLKCKLNKKYLPVDENFLDAELYKIRKQIRVEKKACDEI